MDRKPDIVPSLGAQLGHPSRRRDTAEACRGKAKENLILAVSMPSGRQRALFERSAAAWAMRAEQLQRQETRLAAALPTPDHEVEHVRL